MKHILILIFISIQLLHADTLKLQKKFESIGEWNQKNFYIMGRALMEENLFFSAIPFMKEALYLSKKGEKQNVFDRDLSYLIDRVGTRPFENLPLSTLNKSNSPFTKFIIGKNLYQRNENKKAAAFLSQIPNEHRIYTQAQFLLGQIYSKAGVLKTAFEYFSNCYRDARSRKNDFKMNHLKITYQYLEDSCQVAIPRMFYKAKQYKLASKLYRNIPIESYKWPDIVLEDAWAGYMQNDFNLTIGRLLTYRAPFLEDYFYPEAEVLQAVGHLKMCLYDDVQNGIEYFEQTQIPIMNELITVINQTNRSKNFFIKLALKEDSPYFKKYKILKKSMRRLKNEPSFLREAYYLKKALQEFKFVNTLDRKSPFAQELKGNLRYIVNNLMTKLNLELKNRLVAFINDFFVASEQLAFIALDVATRLKESAYANTELVKKDVGTIDIDRSDKQTFWEFKKEFWADELGLYIYGKQSQCLKVSKTSDSQTNKGKEI